MISHHLFTDNIVLVPSQLANIDANITKIIMQRVGTCTKEYGYVTSISNIRRKSNIISRTSGSCVFQVAYTATCIKPVEGETLSCQVVLSFPEGMLVTHEKMRIIVPRVQYSVGSTVDVILVSIRYESSEYQCVGALKSDLI